MLDAWVVASSIAKLGLYLGTLIPTGIVLSALIFKTDLCRGLTLWLACLGLLATLCDFGIRAAVLTGDALGAVDPEMLSLLFSTSVGSVFSIRLFGLGALIAGFFIGRGGAYCSVLGGALSLLSFAWGGHVSMQGSTLLTIALVLHLFAIAFWVGILTPLRRLTLDTNAQNQAATVARRFGKVAMCVVPALVLLGGIMAYALAGSVQALFMTNYGQILLCKIAFVGVLLAIAAANKFRFVPSLESGDENAAINLGRSIQIEWVIVMLVLSATAVLTSGPIVPNQ